MNPNKYWQVACLQSCLILLALSMSSCGDNSSQGQDALQEYDLLTVETMNHSLQTEYPAQIKGAQDIRIIPRVDGYLERTLVKEGQNVKRGQLLFVIDQVAYRSAVKTAEASVLQAEAAEAKARQEYESVKKLHESGIVSDYDVNQSKRDVDIAVANLAAAKAQSDIAHNSLSFTELRSPSDGVIGRLPYRKGDYVGPSIQDGLTVISDNHEMHVYFSLSERNIMDCLTKYKNMQDAIDNMPDLSLVLPGGNIYAHTGRVDGISGIVDDLTGAVSVRAVFPNDEGLLLSGGTARVRMVQEMNDAIVIPQEATYEVLNKVFVYLVEDGVAKSHMVTVESLNNGSDYVVTAGLNVGDVIIGKGASLVKEGTKVK